MIEPVASVSCAVCYSLAVIVASCIASSIVLLLLSFVQIQYNKFRLFLLLTAGLCVEYGSRSWLSF